jgi:hypothetical protein
MRGILLSIIVAVVAVPAVLVLAQINNVDTFERGLRPHVSQGKIGTVPSVIQPQRKTFRIDGVEYASWLRGASIEDSPDWVPDQPIPLKFAQLESIARQQLAKLVTNDASWWSVTSFQLHSIAGRQSLKWYFRVEMKPIWEPGPPGTDPHGDSFCVSIDLAGNPGLIGRKVDENQWMIQR